MLFTRGGGQQNASACPAVREKRGKARFQHMANRMQTAQPDGNFRKVTNIIFPARAKKAGGGRKQAKINLWQRQAARAKHLNKGHGIVGIAKARQCGKGFNIFGCRRRWMTISRFISRIV
jgi:hypothetical protein